MPGLRIAVAVCVMLASASLSTAVAGERDAIPPDFSLRAEYYPPLPHSDIPGVKRWHPWTMSLTADGRAEQESSRTVPGKRKIVRKRVRVSPRDVQRLVAEARGSNFYLLAPEHAFEGSPHATLVLRIAVEGPSHQVTGYHPDRAQDDAPEW